MDYVSDTQLNPIPDIFDRLTMIEAVQRNLPLITRDTVITNSGLVNVVWD